MPSYKDYLLSFNPTSLWALDEVSGSVAYDAKAVQNGTFNGTPTFNQTPYFSGDDGKCIRFTKSSNQWVTIPDNSAHRGVSSIIIEAWFKLSTVGDTQVILCKWGSGGSSDDFYQIYVSGSQLRIEMSSGISNSSKLYSIGAGTTNWYHVVATKRFGNYRNYLNGTLLESFSSFSGAINNASGQPLYIGEGTGSSDNFNGWIDNVAIYTGTNVPSTDGDLDAWVQNHYYWQLEPLVTNFSYDKSTGDSPLLVQFTDLSSGKPAVSSWLWNFGDGSTSTQKSPTHSYTEAGIYSVSLTASNVLETATETKSDIIDVLMVADFSVVPLEGILPNSIVRFFDSTQGEPTSWLWDFGDGYTSTEQNPTHSYSRSGEYTVSLTASNSEKSDTEVKEAIIDVPIIASFHTVPSEGILPNSIVQFYDDTQGEPTSWLWDFGDGYTSTEQNPTHSYSRSGEYTVSLTASNSEKSGIAENLVDIPIIASFHIIPENKIVPGTPVQFYDDTIGEPTSWLWDFGDGYTSTEQNPVHTYTYPGYYTITFTAMNEEKSDTIYSYNFVHVNIYGSLSKSNYIIVSDSTLKTLDQAPGSNNSFYRLVIAEGRAQFKKQKYGIRVLQGVESGVSGFTRAKGPSLLFD